MNLLLIFFVFILGTLIGSFLNVVILRYNTGKNILGMGERSMCFSCGKQLHWFELVPVLSFLLQRARCRGCGSQISWQYPLVELATGLLFLAIFVKNAADFVPLLVLLQLSVWSLLMVITVYDLRHKIIPDGLVFAFMALAFVLAAFFPASSAGSLVSAVAAAVAFFAFFAGLWFVSGGRWLGFGDAKLVVGVGLLLGLARGVMALALAFWIGAAVSVVLIFGGRALNFLASHSLAPKVIRESRLRLRLRLLTMKSEIPFAPFIILGTLIAFFCQTDILGLDVFQLVEFSLLTPFTTFL